MLVAQVIFFIIALVLFLIGAIGVPVGRVSLVALGLLSLTLALALPVFAQL